MEFLGYKRDEGKYGVRNHVLVVSSVSCANGVVDAIGRLFPDVITIQHTYGCGYGPNDFMTSMKVLSGIINNPNVGAVLVVGLGCELLKADYLAQAAQGKPAEALVIQQAGSAATTKKGIDITENFLSHLAQQKRVPVIKVSSNSNIFNNMAGDIDINAGSILDEGTTIDHVGREIFELCLKVASGELTRAEINKSTPFSCLKTGPTF